MNRIWWRLSDIILLRAECRARLNKPEAIDDLNSVRTARTWHTALPNIMVIYVMPSLRNGKKLLLEGHRYFDIIRNGYANLELEGGFRTATQQDFIDGAFSSALR
ncbi:MAG: RagB/SusD family nutrient uptake outer membrane protein [Butyricimonas faecihominis]